jgi:hypothetical protein
MRRHARGYTKAGVDRAQHMITGSMAIGIVDVLEPVEIEQRQPWPIGAIWLSEMVLQRRENGPAVPASGEVIDRGLPVMRAGQFGALLLAPRQQLARELTRAVAEDSAQSASA